MMLNTRPISHVFKQHPWDPANVNAWKNMCDPYSGLSILLHDVISLQDATSYDRIGVLLANSIDLDKTLRYLAFYMCLHCF